MVGDTRLCICLDKSDKSQEFESLSTVIYGDRFYERYESFNYYFIQKVWDRENISKFCEIIFQIIG